MEAYLGRFQQTLFCLTPLGEKERRKGAVLEYQRRFPSWEGTSHGDIVHLVICASGKFLFNHIWRSQPDSHAKTVTVQRDESPRMTIFLFYFFYYYFHSQSQFKGTGILEWLFYFYIFLTYIDYSVLFRDPMMYNINCISYTIIYFFPIFLMYVRTCTHTTQGEVKGQPTSVSSLLPWSGSVQDPSPDVLITDPCYSNCRGLSQGRSAPILQTHSPLADI